MKEEILKTELDGALELCGAMISAEENILIGNSFFDRSYFGTRILIIATKPSDEILLAGNLIVTMAAAKAEIFIAYRTKKNFYAEILKELGLKDDKIIFFTSKAELKQIILELGANIIICADYDEQPEYKNLSAEFEEVLGEILREDKTYRPEIYKKFALATALNAPPDFYAQNILATVAPKVGVTDGYNYDLIERGNYSWQNRVRFPVLHQNTLLKDNPVAKAIFEYKNFGVNLDALRF